MAEPLTIAAVVSGAISLLTAIGTMIKNIRAKKLNLCCGLLSAEMSSQDTPNRKSSSKPASQTPRNNSRELNSLEMKEIKTILKKGEEEIIKEQEEVKRGLVLELIQKGIAASRENSDTVGHGRRARPSSSGGSVHTLPEYRI